MNEKFGPLHRLGAALFSLFALALGDVFLQPKNLLLVGFGVLVPAFLVIPIAYALPLFFVFVGLEGYFKIVSHYHPLIHIGSALLAGVLFAKSIFNELRQARNPWKQLPPFSWLFFLLFAWFALSLFNPYSLGIVPTLAGAKMYVAFQLLFFVGFWSTRSNRDLLFVVYAWLLVVAIQVGFSLFEGAKGPSSMLELSSAYAEVLDRYKNLGSRPFGLTHYPGGGTVYIFLGFPLVLWGLYQTRSWILRAVYATLIPAAFLVLFLCQVRSTLLKTIFGGVLFIAIDLFTRAESSLRKKMQRLLIVTSVAIAGVLVMPSLFERFIDANPMNSAAIKRSFTAFDYEKASRARGFAGERFFDYATRVPFGAGMSRTGAAAGVFLRDSSEADTLNEDFFTDNLPLAVLVDLGIPGFLLFVSLVFAIMFTGARAMLGNDLGEMRVLYIALFSGLTASVVGAYGAEAFLYNPEASFFWFFGGVLAQKANINFRRKPA